MTKNICSKCEVEFFNQSDLCIFCNTPNITFMNQILVCDSKLDQKEINHKIKKFIIEHNRVPSILEIDPEAKLSNIPLYKFDNNKKLFPTNLFNIYYFKKKNYFEIQSTKPDDFLFNDSILMLL